ncbi:MAG: polyribonucleotide nucleotidyltransferase [bacterium]
MPIHTVSREIAGRTLTIETGRIAGQAGGAVTTRYGDTIALSTVTMAAPRMGIDFFPLTVDYREQRAAAGKFPGGFFKREGRPSDRETLTSRCIDRPVRPLFPDGFNNEVQILGYVLSFDNENDSDILAMIGSFAALEISDIPFNGPVAAIRIGKVNGALVVNPTVQQLEAGTLNLTIAGKRNAVLMVEGGAREESEETLLEALELAMREMTPIFDMIEELRGLAGKPKVSFEPKPPSKEMEDKIWSLIGDRFHDATGMQDKHQRQEALDNLSAEASQRILEEAERAFAASLPSDITTREAVERVALHSVGRETAQLAAQIREAFGNIEKRELRRLILEETRRVDGRALDQIRPISIDVGSVPRTHGSALFTRGQTQALVTTTLGTVSDEQKIDGLLDEYYKRFLLHYNFPPFCVGEVRPTRGPGRRDIGHGALAERAIAPLLPEHDDFPYTIRLVSDILESNGSSSMASVCGGSLSLMDAGVPIKKPVAGIAMGLVKEGDRSAILSDILGVEDHLGDMDFKVAGTADGITAFQMDLKIEGVDHELMAAALEQARRGRLFILERMSVVIGSPRSVLSPYAPRIQVLLIPIDRIRDVIGPGGKMIRQIVAETGVKIDIDDDGQVLIASTDVEAGRKAREWIETLTEEVEVDKIYKGKVTRLMTFGAFVEILPGQEGLVHISELAEGRIDQVEDVVKEGDTIQVKVTEIDSLGRVNLSKRLAERELGIVPESEWQESRPQRPDRNRPRSGGSDRRGGGGRGGDRRGGGGGRNDRGGGSRGGGYR